MKQTKQQLQQFSALITDLLKLTKFMSVLLDKESDALQKRAPEALGKLVEEKKQIAKTLNLKTHQLDHFLVSCGLKNGKEGMMTWLQALPASHPIQSDWSKLEVLTRACAKQNEINGTSVRVMQQHTKRSLDMLRGPHQSDTFYGADGYSKRENHSNSILTV